VPNKTVKVAIIDLYNNAPNQGMRSIKLILDRENLKLPKLDLVYQVFETRYKSEIPNLSDFDIFISTGGPGDPHDGIGTSWERKYFKLIDAFMANNANIGHSKKYFFSICHSFQLMCRYFELADVVKRRSTSFGIFPCHPTEAGLKDPVFQGLADPFYVVDSRDWQCVNRNDYNLDRLGAQILSLEKIRPHVNLERALMAIRISPYWVGTQFHPEADPIGMMHHLKQEDKRADIIKNHGEDKYNDMLEHLEDTDKIHHTNKTILPNFIHQAIAELRPQTIEIESIVSPL
jgi:GMP synthase-like glutamine amidotransferase